jgi:type I restriction-modification system DNA methylase subunit
MTPTKDYAHSKFSELVTRFEEQQDSYKSIAYNETPTRRDFIDPFFKALGWDVDNAEGYAESYREVIHEDRVKVGGVTKAPDYSFRLVGGKRLFFVEAKKPSVLLKDAIAPAYQVRSYGWSAKLPISILTDFAEFAIYDCTKKPTPTDKAATARIKYIPYTEYLNEFDFIWDTFSKERVLKGGLDRFIQTDTYKKGTATVDNDFLQALDRWRTHLAKSISKNNKNLDEDAINFVVQQTIDRIIFLRIAEDRSIEPYGILKENIKQGNLYQNLFNLFVKADEKYNSGLFDFDKKDKISHSLEIDNEVIKTIINELYYPESPYKFAYMPVEILGTAYEQFLGNVIRITPGHQAKIEPKPEVRKAGGVYYTPQYIVDYIVKNTVGKLVEGKTPKEVSKIKIVDPACGSGSFLLGAYQCLLDYHKNYYTGNGKIAKGIKGNTLTPDGELTTDMKKRILLNNIYGVDIDFNAVEVTKLSLLLKCMEGETEASIATQMRLFHDRVLPDLDNNIKSGNSLIDTDYYDTAIDFGDERKIKPFHWQQAFPEVFKQGGFDAVVGNPPYYLVEDDGQKTYFKKRFKTLHFKINLFTCFCEVAQYLVKKDGLLGFIIPNLLFANDSLTKLREHFIKDYRIKKLINLGDGVFAQVSMPTMIFIVEKTTANTRNIIGIYPKVEGLIEENTAFKIRQTDFLNNFNFVFDTANPTSSKLIKRVEQNSLTIEDVLEVNQGIITGDDKKYLSVSKENSNFKQTIRGKDIAAYQTNYPNLFVHYQRDKLACPRTEDLFDVPEKLLMRRTGDYPVATYDNKRVYNLHTLYSCRNKSEYSIKFILALLNSRLLRFLYQQKLGTELGRVFAEIKIVYIRKLPVPKINLNGSQKGSHDEIVKNVEHLLKLNEEITEAKLQSRVEQLEAHIDHCENKINEIVYRLYGLTGDEIKTVEESLNK